MKIGNINVISDTNKLAAAISSIHSRGKRLDADIHRAAVSAVSHRIRTGDNSYCKRLVEALPKGTRGSALVKWFEKFGSVVRDEVVRDNFKNATGETVEEMGVRLAAGAAEPFWMVKSMETGDAFDVESDLGKVIGFLGRHLKVASESDTEKSGEYVEAMNAALKPLKRLHKKVA